MSRPVDLVSRPILPGRASAVSVFVAATVALQISYPLSTDDVRTTLTVATVATFAAASLCHAGLTYGLRGLTCCAAAAAIGFAAETAGTYTAMPFGDYHYAESLGPQVGQVPVVVALAWTMMAWPAAVVARRLARSTAARVGIGTWALASWDLFLDPQMVAAGHWIWTDPNPHLPGIDTVPLTNLGGWILVSAAISLVVQGILRTTAHRDDRWMLWMFLWVYASSVVALAAWLNLGAAAFWGALGMGAVSVPLALRLRQSTPRG